jgi:hypothetical protein
MDLLTESSSSSSSDGWSSSDDDDTEDADKGIENEPEVVDKGAKGVQTEPEVVDKCATDVQETGCSDMMIDDLSDAEGQSVSSESVLSDQDVPLNAEAVDRVQPLHQRGLALAARNIELEREFAPTASVLGIEGRANMLKFWRLKRRSDRKSRRQKRKLEVASGKLEATRVAWNKGKLRRGDRLDPDHDHRRTLRGQCKKKFKGGKVVGAYGNHPRAWTLSGTIELAFSKLGQLTPDANSLNLTRRALDGVAVVALCAKQHQDDALKAWQLTLAASESKPKWFFSGGPTIRHQSELLSGSLATWHLQPGTGTRTRSQGVRAC